MKKLIVFDVNETLLDLKALDPHFERVFNNASVRASWFATVLRNSLVSTVTGLYDDFGVIAGASLDMTAQQAGVVLSDEDKNLIMGTIRFGETQIRRFSTFHADEFAAARGRGAVTEFQPERLF
jgi:2-haloacid dehalogenase